MPLNRRKLLRKIPLFSELSDAELDIALETSIEHRYANRTIVLQRGDEGDHMLVVCSGKVRVIIQGADGRELILRDFGSGHYVGELSVFDDLPRAATIQTIEKSTLLRLQREPLMKLIEHSPPFAKKVIANLSRRLRETTEQLRQNVLFDVYGRIMLSLIETGKHEGRQEDGRLIVPKPANVDFANTIGCRSETLGKALKDLEELRFITISKERRTIILEKRGLADYTDLA